MNTKQVLSALKASHTIDKVRELKNKRTSQLLLDAAAAARIHQDAAHNKLDRFAYGRAYNAVKQGILTLKDFMEGPVSC